MKRRVVMGAVLAVLLGLGALLVLVPPPFMHPARKAQWQRSECKAYLKAWLTAARDYRLEHDVYVTSPAKVGFSPERGNRNAYLAGPGPLEDRSTERLVGTAQAVGIGVDTARRPNKRVRLEQVPADVVRRLGVSGACPACELTVACVAQLDEDEGVDIWTLSSGDRPGPEGTIVHAGEFIHELDDLPD